MHVGVRVRVVWSRNMGVLRNERRHAGTSDLKRTCRALSLSLSGDKSREQGEGEGGKAPVGIAAWTQDGRACPRMERGAGAGKAGVPVRISA